MPSAMRLLVVDDNAVFREELSDFLRSEGHDAETAPTVARAVELLEKTPFDLVLTDLRMPRQSGLDFLRILRERWPGLLAVMITGKAGVDSAVEAMKLGAFDYVSKPFRTEQIRETLRLAAEERAFVDRSTERHSSEDVIREISTGGTPLLVAAERPPPGDSHLVPFSFDGRDLSPLRDAVLAFLSAHPDGGVVLPEADRMLRHHRIEDVVAFLGDLRGRVQGGGPLVIGYDPRGLDPSAAGALRTVVAGPAVHGTLEAMSNPIRRRVLARLEAGPASFTETMRAAGLDDSPKMSFHLHRLVEIGLIARAEEEYRLTPSGQAAIATLHQMESAASQVGRRDFVFLQERSEPRPSRRRSATPPG